MAYYTDYDISENSEEIQEAIEEKSSYGGWYDGRLNAEWDQCEEDCKGVSLSFPDQVIIVKGEGEVQGDIWKAYFKNGKMQACKGVITYPEFDESKLK